MTNSRFARALSQYLTDHSQLDLSNTSGIERSIISRIANGRRPPTSEAARGIISAISGADRITLLTAWLEDQIPDRCAGLITIQPAEHATQQGTQAARALPTTDEEKALAWLQHQLATNVHAVHMVIDLWRASGSPSLPLTTPEPGKVTPINYADIPIPDGTGTARVASDSPED